MACTGHTNTVSCSAHSATTDCITHSVAPECTSHVTGACVTHDGGSCPAHTNDCPAHPGYVGPVPPTTWIDIPFGPGKVIKDYHHNELRVAIINELTRRSSIYAVYPRIVSTSDHPESDDVRRLRDAINGAKTWSWPSILDDEETEIGDSLVGEQYNIMMAKINEYEAECVCDCNYACTCQCNYACTCQCNYACTCQCNYSCTCQCNYSCTCQCNYACTCNCNYCTCNCNYCTCNCNYACTCNCNYV